MVREQRERPLFTRVQRANGAGLAPQRDCAAVDRGLRAGEAGAVESKDGRGQGVDLLREECCAVCVVVVRNREEEASRRVCKEVNGVYPVVFSFFVLVVTVVGG